MSARYDDPFPERCKSSGRSTKGRGQVYEGETGAQAVSRNKLLLPVLLRTERLTDAGLAEESARLGGRGGGRRVLDLSGGGSARLAHGVGAMHVGRGVR